MKTAKAVKLLEKWAVDGRVVTGDGYYSCRVGDDTIRFIDQDGEAICIHVCPVGLVSRSEEDYFPGQYVNSVSAAISLALPDDAKWHNDVAGMRGSVKVTVRLEGQYLKPVAVVELNLETAIEDGDGGYSVKHCSYAGGWKKFKQAEAVALARAANAEGGAAVAALLDWLAENDAGMAKAFDDNRRWATLREPFGPRTMSRDNTTVYTWLRVLRRVCESRVVVCPGSAVCDGLYGAGLTPEQAADAIATA